MDLNKTLLEYVQGRGVPTKYYDQTRINAPLKALLFDYLASEGLIEEEIEKLINNAELYQELASDYIKMAIESARSSYILNDLAFNSKSGIDYSNDYQKANDNANDYYWQIKEIIDSVRANQR